MNRSALSCLALLACFASVGNANDFVVYTSVGEGGVLFFSPQTSVTLDPVIKAHEWATNPWNWWNLPTSYPEDTRLDLGCAGSVNVKSGEAVKSIRTTWRRFHPVFQVYQDLGTKTWTGNQMSDGYFKYGLGGNNVTKTFYAPGDYLITCLVEYQIVGSNTWYYGSYSASTVTIESISE